MERNPKFSARLTRLIMTFIAAVCFQTFAQEKPWDAVVNSHAEKVEEARISYDLAMVRLQKSYRVALENVMPVAQQRGDLAFFEEIEKEIARTSEDLVPPENLSGYSELAKVQEILTMELMRLEKVQAEILVDYADKLDGSLKKIQQTLVQNSRIPEAKELEALRQETMNSEELIKARTLVDARGTSQKVALGTQRLTVESLQKRLKGEVLNFNPATGEIEVAYTFSNPDELADFVIPHPESYKVQDGKLEITIRELTDWWWTRDDMVSDYLLLPYIEVDKSSWVVKIAEHQNGINYHIAFGYSDLLKKTIGAGPKYSNKQFTIEGWTPKEEELNSETFGIQNQYPATLSVEHQGGRIQFELEAGGRKKSLKVRTDDSLTHMGIFPKSWGRGGGGVLILEELRVRGIFKPNWGE